MAGAFVLPLVFVPSIEDVFAGPKLVAAWVLFGYVLLIAMRTSPPLRTLGSAVRFIDATVGVYVVLNLAAAAQSVDRSHSLVGEPLQYQGLLTILLYVGFFYLARIAISDLAKLTLLLGAVAATASVVSLYALMQRLGVDPLWGYPRGGRVFSTVGQPNSLAAYLVMAIPIAASLAFLAKGATRALTAIAAGMMVMATGLTLSRGGYLGLGAAALTFFIPFVKRARVTRRSIIVAIGAITAGLLPLLLLAPLRSIRSDVWNRARSVTDLDRFDVRQQLALWEVGARMAIDHPLLGTGQETYVLLFDEYRDEVLDQYRAGILSQFRPESPHNVYIDKAAGGGLPLAAAYLAVVVGVWVVIARAVRMSTDQWKRVALLGVAAALVGHLITDTFMTAELTGSWTFWVLMGAGLRVAHNHGREVTPAR